MAQKTRTSPERHGFLLDFCSFCGGFLGGGRTGEILAARTASDKIGAKGGASDWVQGWGGRERLPKIRNHAVQHLVNDIFSGGWDCLACLQWATRVRPRCIQPNIVSCVHTHVAARGLQKATVSPCLRRPCGARFRLSRTFKSMCALWTMNGQPNIREYPAVQPCVSLVLFCAHGALASARTAEKIHSRLSRLLSLRTHT